MTDLYQEQNNATLLERDEREGLLLNWITTRAELNEAERNNIESGAIWAQKFSITDLLTVRFVIELHKRMFGKVWSWAGKFRQTEKNIGISPELVGANTAMLLDDARYWVEHQSYDPTELAVRLHHRLVYVHPFPNGNGRHARMMADLTLIRMQKDVLSWGKKSYKEVGSMRSAYIRALRLADREDYEALIKFARA